MRHFASVGSRLRALHLQTKEKILLFVVCCFVLFCFVLFCCFGLFLNEKAAGEVEKLSFLGEFWFKRYDGIHF
jgi:hypothetical protein